MPPQPEQQIPQPVSKQTNLTIWVGIGTLVIFAAIVGIYLFQPQTFLRTVSDEKVKEYSNVNFFWVPINQATSSNYAVENSTVVFNNFGLEEPIASSSITSFEVAAYQGATTTMFTNFARDTLQGYFSSRVIDGADPQTFKILPYQYIFGEYYYSKDDKAVYYKNTKIDGADPATFEPLTLATSSYGIVRSYGKDKRFVYNGAEVMQDVDVTSATIVGTYIKDKTHVANAAAQDIDPNSFTYLGGNFYKDRMRYYCGANDILHVENPLTFKILSQYFATDKNLIYSAVSCSSIANSDPNSFQLMTGYGDTYAKDNNNVYIEGNLAPGIDPKTFEPINALYVKDLKNVYMVIYGKATPIVGADPTTFHEIPVSDWYGYVRSDHYDLWAHDRSSVYYYGEKINDADPTTFTVMGPQYAKDLRNVYYGKQVIQKADAATFVASSTNALFASDKYRHYSLGQPVVVNPAMVDYIVQKRKEGYSDEQIRVAIAAKGYDNQSISLAFEVLGTKSSESGWAPPPTCTLAVSQKNIHYGQTMTLTWKTVNASEVHWTVDNQYGSNTIGLPPGTPSFKGDSIEFTPKYTSTSIVGVAQTYGIGLAVSGAGGSTQCTEYIRIDPTQQ